LLTVFAVVLSRALRYLPFRARVARRKKQLIALLIQAGVKPQKAAAYAGQLLQLCAGDPAKLAPELQRVGMGPEQQAPLLAFAQQRLAPVLRGPVLDTERGWFANSRWAIEFNRAFALALLALFWFFLVPVPALIVFTAENYRFTVSLQKILIGLGWTVAGVIIADSVARLVQILQAQGFGRGRLHQRFHACFARLRILPHDLSRCQCAHAFALLSDFQTYLDQRSYAYADRALRMTERLLGIARSKAEVSGPEPASPERVKRL
jgi:hypothetical protein